MTVPVSPSDEPRPRVAPVVITAAILASVGGLLCSLINYGMALAGIDLLPLRVVFNTPIGFPVPVTPLRLLVTLLGLLVVAVVVTLIFWAVARAASRRRGFAAVFFGGWVAVIIAGWLSALATSPLIVIDFRYPADMIGQLILQRVGSGGGWGLYWGWITGLVCGLIFTAVNRKS